MSGSLLEACRRDGLDAIIFDLGGVILNLNFELTFEALRVLVPHLPRDHFVGDRDQASVFSRYEVGKISTPEFIAEFNRVYGSSVAQGDFVTAWSKMILDMPADRLQAILDLRREGRKIFLLSNDNELHEFDAEARFVAATSGVVGAPPTFTSVFDKVYWSHRVGMRKPGREVFELIVRENGLTASRTLFIDDSEQHIVGARELGMQTYHHQRNREW